MAILPPSSVVTVIVAVPALTAVTLPSETEATELSLLFHVTFLLVALAGLIVTVKVISSPSVSSKEVLPRVTPATAITSDSGIGPSHDVDNCMQIISKSDVKKHWTTFFIHI